MGEQWRRGKGGIYFMCVCLWEGGKMGASKEEGVYLRACAFAVIVWHAIVYQPLF